MKRKGNTKGRQEKEKEGRRTGEIKSFYLCTIIKDGDYLYTTKKFTRISIPSYKLSFTYTPFWTE